MDISFEPALRSPWDIADVVRKRNFLFLGIRLKTNSSKKTPPGYTSYFDKPSKRKEAVHKVPPFPFPETFPVILSKR
jgi:hypothetical protein